MRDGRAAHGALCAVLFLGMLGAGAELLLIEHDEDWKQRVPLLAVGLGCASLAWYRLAPGARPRLVLRAAMLGLVLSAAGGLYLHYESNAAFQRELSPELGGWRLALEALRMHSPPSLAPGALALLGALGWILTHEANSD